MLGRRFEFRVEKIGGAVDKNIQPAELFRGFLEEPPDVRNLREIRREGRAAPPQFLHFRNGAPRFRARGPVMNDHVRAFLRKPQRHRPPQALCRTGDQGHAALEGLTDLR